VVKGFLLITPHALIFHPDVSEILVVDQGPEYYKVHLMMKSVCSAAMFDDIASMVVHDPLQPGQYVASLYKFFTSPHHADMYDVRGDVYMTSEVM
jgi:hypothetical protein